MNDVTFDALKNAVIIVLGVFGLIETIGKGIDTIKSWRKPQMLRDNAQTEAIRKCVEKLDNDKRRLDKHAQDIDDLREGQRNLCIGVQALLEHALHNGNADEMKAASDNIKKWLVGR